jgi:hypothetical protein
MQFAADLVPLQTPGEPNLQQMVGMNLPLNQLACTGIGQAQPLTMLIRAIQREADAGRTEIVGRCLDRVVSHAMASRTHISRPRRAAERAVLKWIKRRLLRWLASNEPARYSRLFLTRPHIRDRFRRYYRASVCEMRQLSREHGLDLPMPTHVVFGHTHQPI